MPPVSKVILLGETTEARERVRGACRIDGAFKKPALEDPDLTAIWVT
jgi:hypothetical protein